MLIPRQIAPELTVSTVQGETYDLELQAPQHFSLVVFYRGLHCPICATYLKELEHLTPEFLARGVEPIAISGDSQERAQKMAEKIGAQHLRIGYELPLDVARNWGLYMSESRGKTSIGIEEPGLFSEPGVFLIKPDHTLYFISVQSMPFVRPSFTEMLQAVDTVLKINYPARGEYTGTVLP